MRLARGAWVGATIAAVAIACSSFDEPPGMPDPSDGGDGGGSEVSTSSDGGGDAKADAGACMPAPSGCAGGIVQMLDFNSAPVNPVGWTLDEDNGSVTHQPTPGPCSPTDGFLRATTTIPNDAEASGTAYLTNNFTGSFKSARLSFAFRGPEPLPDGYANLGCLLVLRGAASAHPRTNIRLTLMSAKLIYGASVRGADGGVVATGPDVSLDQAVSATTAGQWHTLDTRFAITNDAVTVSPTYDGKQLGVFQAILLAPAGRADIECGIDYSDGPDASYTHDIDDAFIELCP